MEKISNMNVAITGSNGFIGKVVAKAFQNAGHFVTTLERGKEDLFKFKSLKKFVEDKDIIIHLAGVNRASNLELIKGNVYATASLLEAIDQYNPRARLLFSSSSQVYLKRSLYGLSKKTAEDICQYYALERKINSTSLRIANVYGPNGKPFYNSVVATFIHLIKKGEDIQITGDGEQTKDFIFVEDVAKAFLKLAEKEIKRKFMAIDICTEKQTSINSIAKKLIKISGKKINISYLNSNVVYNNENNRSSKDAFNLFQWKAETSLLKGLKIAYDKT